MSLSCRVSVISAFCWPTTQTLYITNRLVAIIHKASYSNFSPKIGCQGNWQRPSVPLNPHLTCDSLGPSNPQPKRHLHWFNRFCKAHYCDRPTDHATRSVTRGRIYVRSTAMRPKNQGRWLTELRFLGPTRHKIGYFGDVKHSKSTHTQINNMMYSQKS